MIPDRPPASLPPHLFAQLVNDLRLEAELYTGTQQLRARLARALYRYVIPEAPKK